MRGKRRLGVFVALLVLFGSVIPLFTLVMAPPPTPKGVYGIVFANATGVGPYNSDPAKNGIVSFYIQNETNNGTDTDVYKYDIIIGEYYWNSIEDNIPKSNYSSYPGVVVVDAQNGSFATGDRAGYVAYVSDILDITADQQFPDTELRKIPIPRLIINGTNFIEFQWDPLPDPLGLIAGYTVYRSTDNNTWNRVSGDKDDPIVGTVFNDTSVAAGTSYYYAIKVCFVGYSYDIPANVDNFESTYPGEGSSMMNSTKSSLGVNYIVIQENALPGGPQVTTITIDVGKSTPPVFAVGYNGTPPGTFVGLVEVDWTRDQPSLGYCNPTKDTQTVFSAYYAGGSVEVKGRNNTLDVEDTFTVIINPPSVDYIRLTDSENGTKIPSGPWWVGDPLPIYASAYNLTGSVETYVGLVDVTWSDSAGLGGFSPPGPGNSTTYTGSSGGITTIKGEYTVAIYDEFQLDLQVSPTVDYILITSDPNGDFPIIGPVDIPIGEQIIAYASGYNYSFAFIKLMDVDWTLTPLGPLGYIDNLTGTKTTFFANITITGGSLILNATSATNPDLTDEFTVNVLKPKVDYIYLTNTPGGTPYNLATQTVNVGLSITIYASGYNNTGNVYLWLVDVIWTDVPDGGDFNVSAGTSVTFTGVNDGVTSTITGQNSTLAVSDSFDVNIVNLTVDYIVLVDELGVELTSVTLNVGDEITIQAFAYNDTGPTLLGAWVVDWSDSPDLGEFSVDTGSSTIFTAGLTGGTTTITGTDAILIISDSFSLTIKPPTVDYILIVDTSGTGAAEIGDQTVDVGFKLTGYAAAFNYTALYIGDVQVDWDVINADGAAALTDPDTGESSEFDSHNAGGTATWTAEYAVGITDEVVFTINAPTVDYIQIRTEAGDLGEVVDTAEFNLDGVHTAQYYCAAYSLLAGYIGDVSAEWAVTGGIGTVVASGQFTVFTATTAGTGTITATHTYDSTDVTNVTGDISVYTKPTTPTGLQVQQVAAGGVLNLVWSANPEGYVDGYDIWRSLTNVSGSFELIAESVTGTSYQNTGLTNGETYYYYIIAAGDYLAPNASDPSVIMHNVADADTNGDGTFNLQDDDDDGDGLLDTEEDKNGDGRIEGDTNNDRIWDDNEDWKETDPLNPDTDGDGHNDKEDEYPLDPNKWKKEEEEFPVLLVLIPIIIIIIVLILLMLLLKKRKPAEIPAVPEEERELPPPPGAPVEEEEGALPEEEELPPEEEAPPEGEEEISEEEMPPEEELPESEKETPP